MYVLGPLSVVIQLATTEQCIVLQVINGHLQHSPVLGIFCGRRKPNPVESSGNTMVVHFRTDGMGSSSGFLATYTSDSPAGQFNAESLVASLPIEFCLEELQ
jgi:hypothetical protein